MLPPDKDHLRDALRRPNSRKGLTVGGLIAEHLRRMPIYRQASQVFIDPSPLLKQSRINAMLDGKTLIMPAPGLKEGFYLFAPYSVSFARLAGVVTGRELSTFGRRLAARKEIASLSVDLLLAEGWAVDANGHVLGEGKGFFDLSIALLKELGGLSEAFKVMVALQNRVRLISFLPHDPWDVLADLIVAPEGPIPTTSRPPGWRPEIIWDALSLDRIRRVTPLWKLYVELALDR